MVIERSEKGQLTRREKAMERCRDNVERFHCDDSRVNFSREIELEPLNAVKRRPNTGGKLQTAVHEQLRITTAFLSRWL